MNSGSPDDRAQLTPAEARALAHPTRVRLWMELGQAAATISQLSHQLSLNKGSVSHHLAVLRAAGLIVRGPSRTVRGGTEHYFERRTDRVQFDHQRGVGTTSDVMMRQIADDVADSHDPRIHHRLVRLTRHQARQLAEHLDTVLHGLEPADDRHERYGVLTAVYPVPTSPGRRRGTT